MPPPPSPAITGRLGYGGFGLTRCQFAPDGIHVQPWPGGQFSIGWPEIDFVSFTPAWQRDGDGWRLLQSGAHPGGIADLPLTSLEIVVKDRHALSRGKSSLARFWLLGRIRPLYGADDRREPSRGNLELVFRLKNLSARPVNLVALVAAHCRLDLVVHF